MSSSRAKGLISHHFTCMQWHKYDLRRYRGDKRGGGGGLGASDRTEYWSFCYGLFRTGLRPTLQTAVFWISVMRSGSISLTVSGLPLPWSVIYDTRRMLYASPPYPPISCFLIWSPRYCFRENTSYKASHPFKCQWPLYVPPGLTFKNSAFCPHSVMYVSCMCLRTNSHYFPV
jgi:hypothetical protein